MFDESTCFNCGKPSSGNSLYCSETCRIQDCADASASASNSSVAPSSASSSPSRKSPKIVPVRNRSSRANGLNRQYGIPSRTSSHTSSPSLHSSDLPEFSDYDVEVVALHSKPARVAQDPTFNQALFQSSQKVMDHAFWKSRYAEMGTPSQLSAYEREAASNGPKSVPGIPTTLHYIRKPGPINASNNAGASKLASGFSPYKGNSHKRYGSEHGFHAHISRGDHAQQGKLSKRGSMESATSSTPRSKAAVAYSPPPKRLQSTTSESTLSASISKSTSAHAAGGVRHVSDTIVHTLRKTIEPLTAVDLPVETPSSFRRSSVRTDSLALSTLKDVARSHGMMEGKTHVPKPRLAKESSISSLGRPAHLLELNTKTKDASIQNSRVPPQYQEGTEKYTDEDRSSPDQEGRGRSRKVHAPSRSPSPPTWASWAEDEPIDRRRGRSARRGQ